MWLRANRKSAECAPHLTELLADATQVDCGANHTERKVALANHGRVATHLALIDYDGSRCRRITKSQLPPFGCWQACRNPAER